MKSIRYIPIEHDNRGTRDSPFGFVYLALPKGTKEAGRIGYGGDRNNPDPLATWACRDTPGNAERQTWADVRAYLGKQFPHLRDGKASNTRAAALKLVGDAGCDPSSPE